MSSRHSCYTGKERDTESGGGSQWSGNDYFGARYYSSTMGRFMSPDWSAKVEPVPYSKMGNPQSLNLYAYVGNSPLGAVDMDGHDGNARQGVVDDPNQGNMDQKWLADNASAVADANAKEQWAFSGNVDWSAINASEAAQPQSAVRTTLTQTHDAASNARNQANYYTAEYYLEGSSVMRDVVRQFNNGGFSVLFINDGNDHYDSATKTVSWDPSTAIKDTDGHTISPALALGHEMVHALGGSRRDRLAAIPDRRFDTKEEKRVIRGFENPAARQLHEGVRDSHHGSIYTVHGVDQR